MKLPLIPIVLVAALTVWAVSGWRLALAVLLGGVVEALDTAWSEPMTTRAGHDVHECCRRAAERANRDMASQMEAHRAAWERL